MTEEIPNILINPNFRNDFNEFISHWEKEAEGLKNREITEDDSYEIISTFTNNRGNLVLQGLLSNITFSDLSKLNLVESKLQTSLSIARSNYRSKHKTLWERLVDSIGRIRLISFGKENS